MSVGLARTGVLMLSMPAHLRPGTRRVPVQTTESPRNREEMHSHTGCVSVRSALGHRTCVSAQFAVKARADVQVTMIAPRRTVFGSSECRQTAASRGDFRECEIRD